MSLFSSFKKPAWQSANAQKRAASVAGDDSPELRVALPRLAIDDPESEVRRAALKRCSDPALFARAMRGDADTSLRIWARERWLAALADGTVAAPAESDLAELSANECEALAVSAHAVSLRRRLIERTRRPGFIAERALADRDPDLRLALVDRIDSIATLERLAQKARKTDKRLFRHANDRAEKLRLATGDDSARHRRAEAICETLERVMRAAEPRQTREDALKQCQDDWAALLGADVLSDALVARYEGACAVIRAQISPPIPVAAAQTDQDAPDQSEVHETRSPSAEPAEQTPPSPEQIAAQVRLQAELAANADEAARERALAEEQRREQERRRSEQDALLPTLDAALEAGDLAQARSIAATLEPAQLSNAGRRQWQALQPRLKKLQDWEHWASNKVRARLCDDIERLIGSGLHPDALATRVREAQQEWRRLDALEGRTSESPPSGLDKRFRVVSARALKPARGFFEKRDALRDERQQQVTTFLDGAESAIDSAGTAALLDLQRTATRHLRELGELKHADRKALAKRLRTLLDHVRPRVQRGFEQIEAERQSLIAAAGRLDGQMDGRSLAAEAKQLMQRWKAIGKGRPGRDQQQWREFRAALDRLFAGLDERRQQAESDRAERVRRAEALVVELETLTALEGDALTGSQSRIRDVRDEWQTLSVRDAALLDRYDAALTRHRDALSGLERDRRRQTYLAMLAQPPDADPSGSPAALEQAQALVFEAEAIAGLDAPVGEREARRRWQLERLQQHLRGDRHADPDAAISDVLQRWQQLGGLSAADRQRYAERLIRAVEQVVAKA